MAMESRLIARSLLDRIPAAEQSGAIKDAVQALTPDASPAEVALTVSLLAAKPDAAAREDLLTFLLRAVQRDALSIVEAACENDEGLRKQLLDLVSKCLGGEARRLSKWPNEVIQVQMNDIVHMSKDIPSARHPEELASEAVRYMLRFAKVSVSLAGDTRHSQELFSAVLVFLGASDHDICRSARDLLCVISIAGTATTVPDHLSVWHCVRRLLTRQVATFYQDLGYGIWLRQSVTASSSLKSWFEPEYWDLIRQGMRDGDAERRKQCLSIFRESVAAAVRDETIIFTVCAEHNDLQTLGKSACIPLQA